MKQDACYADGLLYMSAGERTAIFVGPVPEDKLPKDAAPSRVLTGRLIVAKLPKAAGAGDAPGAVPFNYTWAPCLLAPSACLSVQYLMLCAYGHDRVRVPA